MRSMVRTLPSSNEILFLKITHYDGYIAIIIEYRSGIIMVNLVQRTKHIDLPFEYQNI